MKHLKRLILFFALVIIVMASFVFGYSIRDKHLSLEYLKKRDATILTIVEAYYKIREGFVDLESLDQNKLIYAAIDGMMTSLDDPHSVFFNPEETKKFIEYSDGKFDGVGLEIAKREGLFRVIAPIKGSPADRAGILTGDIIVGVDDTNSDNLTADELVNLIRGEKGTEVVLLIERDGWQEVKAIKLVRESIEIIPLEWEMIEDEIAHIKTYHFSKNAEATFKKVALEISESQAKGIILDVRGNPGGYFDVTKQIGEWFFEKGAVLVIKEELGEMTEDVVKGVGRLSHYPIVVLIDGGSASASEIIAGALRDNRGVLLIGETSFGKGSVQNLQRLRDGSSIKLTVAKWLTPKGDQISEKGLVPDIEIANEMGEDNQLRRAIEEIKNMI